MMIIFVKYKPNGNLALIDTIRNCNSNPAGHIFDLTAGIIFDGLAGRAAGDLNSELFIKSKNANKFWLLLFVKVNRWQKWPK